MEHPPEREDALERWATLVSSAAKYAFSRGNWADAHAFSVTGVEVTKARLGPDHFATLMSLCNSGIDMMRHTGAESIQLQALEGFMRTGGKDN
ncbi:hypothetical protein N7499_011201 [Penicillium canescens]|nr:hypothetical protein N7499_011201 [Penicillium canescens]KAJ6182636.1 hypothetical protein N7485_001278 [Penicillium canescens]